MSNILRIKLTDDQRRELHDLLARRDLTRYSRQRAECIRPLDRGKTDVAPGDRVSFRVVKGGHRSFALRVKESDR